jgi:hypothetical protein
MSPRRNIKARRKNAELCYQLFDALGCQCRYKLRRSLFALTRRSFPIAEITAPSGLIVARDSHIGNYKCFITRVESNFHLKQRRILTIERQNNRKCFFDEPLRRS